EPLARGHSAPDLDLDLDFAVGNAHLGHAQPDRAVGEVEDRARLDRFGQAGPRDAHPPGIPRELLLTADEAEPLARRQLDHVLAQRPDAELWSGEVLEDRHRAPGAVGGLAHAADRLGVLLERP